MDRMDTRWRRRRGNRSKTVTVEKRNSGREGEKILRKLMMGVPTAKE